MAVVQSIMKRDLVVATAQESVATAVQRLATKEVGALLVLEDGRVTGILSERDVLRRVFARGRDPDATRVGQVATPAPTTVRQDATIQQCADLIRERGFRHLPVVNEARQPVGIISARDLLQFVVESLESSSGASAG